MLLEISRLHMGRVRRELLIDAPSKRRIGTPEGGAEHDHQHRLGDDEANHDVEPAELENIEIPLDGIPFHGSIRVMAWMIRVVEPTAGAQLAVREPHVVGEQEVGHKGGDGRDGRRDDAQRDRILPHHHVDRLGERVEADDRNRGAEARERGRCTLDHRQQRAERCQDVC